MNFLPKYIQKAQAKKQDLSPRTPIASANTSVNSFTQLPPALVKCNSATPAERIFHVNNQTEDILEPSESQSVSASPIEVDDDENTPRFDNRNPTAVFGSSAEMHQTLGQRFSALKKAKESVLDKEEEPELLLRSFASKKSNMLRILYT